MRAMRALQNQRCSGDYRALRIGGGQRGAAAGQWRIDPLRVDLHLERLGLGADHLHFALPALGVDRAPCAQVEAGDVERLVVVQRRHAKQVGGDVVAGVAAHVDGVLARHHGVVAFVVGLRQCDVAGGEDAGVAGHAQVAADMHAAQLIALRRYLPGQRAGTHAAGPDHGLGLIRWPSEVRTPSASTAVTEVDSTVFTPSASSACVMTGRGPAPSSAPTSLPRSIITMLNFASWPNTLRRRSGISAATSMPVKPPPTTTTVLRSSDGGRSARRARWMSSLTASSSWSTACACCSMPGTAGRNNLLPVVSTMRS